MFMLRVVFNSKKDLSELLMYINIGHSTSKLLGSSSVGMTKTIITYKKSFKN